MSGSSDLLQVGAYWVHLWLHTSEDPSAAMWDEAIATAGAIIERHNVSMRDYRGLVLSDGGAPNARQRSQLFDMYQRQAAKSAVLTTVLSNPIKRGVATALQWMNPSMRFYQPHQAREALRILDVEDRWDEIAAALDALQTKIPPVAALAIAKHAMRAAAQVSARPTKPL
jgi:hypothetical protein